MARYKRRKLRRKASKSRRLGKRKTSLNRRIKKVLMRNTETKCNQETYGSFGISQTIGVLETYDIIPSVPQGTGQAGRIGNKIQPTKFTLKMSIYCANQAAGTPPTYFDIYIFKQKFANQEGGGPSAVDMALFLQFDNSAKQYLGVPTDGLRPVNTEMFTLVKHKRILMYNPFNTTNHIAATASINPNRCLSFDLTKHIKKTWLYDDNSTLLTNDNMFVAIGATQTDGVPLPGLFGTFVMLTEVKYKDA